MDLKYSNKRLLKLARYLEQLPDGSINMEAWLIDARGGSHSSHSMTVEQLGPLAKVKGKKIQLKSTNVDELRECGFAACAIGWACTIPSFRKAGLRLTSFVKHIHLMPTFHGEFGFDAVQEFFGIDHDIAIHLFASGAYGRSDKPHPKTVAARIRKVVEHRTYS